MCRCSKGEMQKNAEGGCGTHCGSGFAASQGRESGVLLDTSVQRDRSNRLFSVAALHCFLTTVHVLGIDGLHGNVLCSVKVL